LSAIRLLFNEPSLNWLKGVDGVLHMAFSSCLAMQLQEVLLSTTAENKRPNLFAEIL
jgi:hypothetical protein